MTLKLVNAPYETLMPYVPGKPVSETERELGISGCIKLASNENPLGPPKKALAAVLDAAHSVADYPDGGCFYLRAKLATHLGVGQDQIIFGNGTNEVINMLIRTCLGENENLIFADPSFIVYKLGAQALGREIRSVPLKNMRFDLDAMAARIDARTKLVFIANPNNPTGTYVNRSELSAFLSAIPADVVVALDEAYFEYADAPDYPNGLQFLAQRERLVVLRTFSKCYGLAGLRVGYGVSHAGLIDFMNRGREPFNVNTLAQVAAIAALDDIEHLQQSVSLNKTQRQWLSEHLRGEGFGVTQSQANFVLVDFGCDAQGVFDALLRLGVIVRPMAGYGLPTSARITVGTQSQNERLLQAIKKVFSEPRSVAKVGTTDLVQE